MKNFVSKYLLITSIFIGLLVLVTCDNQLDSAKSIVRSVKTEDVIFDQNDIIEEDSIENIGMEYILDLRDGFSLDDIRQMLIAGESLENYHFLISIHNGDGTMSTIPVPVKDYNFSEDEDSGRGEYVQGVEIIIDNNMSDADSLVVTIMGDGFTVGQQGDFIAAAETAANNLISTYPFSLFSNYFKVYAVKVVSSQSGVSRDHDKLPLFPTMITNYFGSSFYGVTGLRDVRCLEIANFGKVKKLKQPNTVLTIVMCNSTRSGGIGYMSTAIGTSSLYIYKNPNTGIPDNPPTYVYTVQHEAGHALGKLWDEYWNGLGADKANIHYLIGSPWGRVKWNDWVGYDGITIEPHFNKLGVHTLYYRPSAAINGVIQCKMGASYKDFCSVCSTHLISEMKAITDKDGYTHSDLSSTTSMITGLSSGLNPAGKILIPSRIGNKTVTNIGSNAFKNKTGITEVKLPQYLSIIGNSAFENLTQLGYIDIPTTVKRIGSSAFAGTDLDDVIEIPASVTRIGKNAFLDSYLWTNTLNYKVVYMDKWVVGYKLTANQTVTINSDTVGIADEAFYNKNVLNNLRIPDSVKYIGAGAFNNNPYLQRIYIPKYVTTIGQWTFSGCNSLTIYAEIKEENRPSGWDIDWNPDNRSVIWGSPEPYKKPVTQTAITVAAPVTGALPAEDITATSQFTGTVKWKNSAGVFLKQNEKFAAGTIYTAEITLTATTDYSLKNIAGNFFTVNGKPASNSQGSAVITTAAFPKTDSIVTDINITGVPKPITGEEPYKGITSGSTQFTGTVVEWYPADLVFLNDESYTAKIELVETTGWTLYNIGQKHFEVAGAINTDFDYSTRTVTATFPPTKTIVGSFDIIYNPYGSYRSSGSIAEREARDAGKNPPKRSNPEVIGTFTLYDDDSWEIEGEGSISGAVDIIPGHFAHDLEWTVPWEITDWLSTGNIADVLFTIQLPYYCYQNNSLINGIYSMDMRVTNSGARILREDDAVSPSGKPVGSSPYAFYIQRADGELKPHPQQVCPSAHFGFYNINTGVYGAYPLATFHLYEDDSWEIWTYSCSYSMPLYYSDIDQYIKCSVGSEIKGHLSLKGKKAVIPLPVEYPAWMTKYPPGTVYFTASIDIEAVIDSSGFYFTGSSSNFLWGNGINGQVSHPVKIFNACGRLVPAN